MTTLSASTDLERRIKAILEEKPMLKHPFYVEGYGWIPAGELWAGAEISQVHANFFINRGRASASDVMILMEKAREAVAKKFGVELQQEVENIGDWPEAGPDPSGEGADN